MGFIQAVTVGGFTQYFYGTSLTAKTGLVVERLLRDGPASSVFETANGRQIIKLIKPHTWHERLKIHWRSGRLFEELRGIKLFNKLGLNTPEVLDYGRSLTVSGKYSSFYVMDNLSLQGYREVADILKHDTTNSARRDLIIKRFYEDLVVLRAHKIVYTDPHLSQVMVNEDNQLCWLDIGFKRYPSDDKRFRLKFNQLIYRLLHNPFCKRTLNQNEIALFNSLMFPE